MALRLLSSFLLILILVSCSSDRDRIDYESEFESIVVEFEKSSILNFDSIISLISFLIRPSFFPFKMTF